MNEKILLKDQGQQQQYNIMNEKKKPAPPEIIGGTGNILYMIMILYYTRL